MTEPSEPIHIFYCYAHADRSFRNELEKHLSPLKRLGRIVEWCDREILPGTEWEHEVDSHLNTAEVIPLLLSPDFFHSDYCYSIEMRKALLKQEVEDASIIPILLRPVHWQETPLGQLQALPTEGKPITKWRNRDEAYWDVVKGIQKIVTPLLLQRYVEKGDTYYCAGKYHDALAAYDQAIRLEPHAALYYQEGSTLLRLQHYDEARVDFEQAIDSDPQMSGAYCGKAVALMYLERYQEALVCCEQAIELDPLLPDYYFCKGDILTWLGKPDEAEAAYAQAADLEKRPLSEWLSEL